MKKFIILLILLLTTSAVVNAETKTYTMRQGVRTMYGYIPTSAYGAYSDCDPYIFTIGGIKYYMLRDNVKSYSRKSLLGCSEKKRTLFHPLEALNSVGDRERLTSAELRRANIRFVKLKTNGKLDVHNKNSDFDLDKIAYVDLRRVRFSLAGTPMGCFDIYVKRDSGSTRKVVARVTAKSHYTVDKMF